MKTTALISISILALISVFSLSFPSSVWATRASLSCVPATGTFNIGDTFTVDYVLDTRSFQAFGADLQIKFDPSILEPTINQSTIVSTSTNWSTATTNTADTSGNIHLDFGNTQAVFTGSATVGKITFKTKQAGQAQFQYTFFQQYDDTTPGVAKIWGKKDDTNLSNILTDVTSCVYIVSSPTTPTPQGPTNTPGGPTSTPYTPSGTSGPTVSELPRTGSTETTFALLFFAILILSIGIAIPALGFRNN